MQKQIKPKKCKSCGELFKPFSSLAKVCSVACSLDYVGKENQKQFKQTTKSMKSKLLDNDKSFWKAKAQKAFNEFIRTRDASDGCISCDKPHDWHGQWHAGHYKTVGARPDLRFDPVNCNKQCSVCNNYLSGNLVNYRDSIIRKWGQPSLNLLEIDQPNIFKTVQDFKEIHAYYTAKIKELKKLSPPDSV